MAWGSRRRAGILPVLALRLSAQGLPAIPRDQPLQAPPPEFLLPYRPFELGPAPSGSALPFAWRGQKVVQEGDRWTLDGGAIQGEGLLLLADHIEYDLRTGELVARGRIRLEAPDLRLRCEKLQMNWRSKSGQAWMLEMDLPPTWTLKSGSVSFETMRIWTFDAVEVTSCPEEKPGWRAKLSKLRVDLDGYAQLWNLRVLLGHLPTHIYLPYGVYPAKLDRASGLLPPQLGTSSTLGTSLGLGYYQTLGPSADATLDPEWFSKEGVLWGGEARWHPTLTHEGSFSGQFINQRSLDANRYRYGLKEVWQGENGWQLAVDANDASDNLVDADFGKGLGQLGQTNFNSSLYFGKAYTWGSLALTADRERTFFLTQNEGDPFYNPVFPSSLERQVLPQLEARLFPVSLGSSFYLDGGLRLSRFGYRLSGSLTAPGATYTWNRGDADLRLYGRLGQLGPFRVDGEAMARDTHYGSTLDQPIFSVDQVASGQNLDPSANPAYDPFRVDAGSSDRLLGSAHIRFSGPQLGRTFEGLSAFGYTGDIKHVVEPFFGFTRTTDFADAAYLPRFDAIDSYPGVNASASNEESFEFGLKQYFFGRGGAGESFNDLARWTLSTRYHFNPIILPDGRVKKGWASLDSDVSVEPSEVVRVSFRTSSDIGPGGTDQSLSTDIKAQDGSRLTLAYFSTGLNQFLVRQKGIQLGGLKRFLDDRFRFEVAANYDFGSSTRPKGFTNSEAALTWVQPCVAYILRYTHVALQVSGTSLSKEDRVDLTISLRSIGDLYNVRQ
ncbi:MAG TPA: putative LPS assembly protein LptD [Holophagaceae bacterium]|nr:putative LPS assembly protein LptD [Holophagaceae bacterium]